MKCKGCEHCVFVHDENQHMFSYRCTARTERGRAIDWSMHTGKLVNGDFVPNDPNDIKNKLDNRISRLSSPYWCPKKKKG